MAAQCGWPLSASSQHHGNLHLPPAVSPSPPSPLPPTSSSSSSSSSSAASNNSHVSSLIHRLAADSAVVVFSVSSCCMCHVVKQLLGGLGVNLTVYEVDELVGGHAAAEAQLLGALAEILGNGGAAAAPVPAVFVGGKLVGGLDHVMAAHISGALVPLLKQAGALWL